MHSTIIIVTSTLFTFFRAKPWSDWAETRSTSLSRAAWWTCGRLWTTPTSSIIPSWRTACISGRTYNWMGNLKVEAPCFCCRLFWGEREEPFAAETSRQMALPFPLSLSFYHIFSRQMQCYISGSRFNGVPGSGLAFRIQIQEGKNDVQKYEKVYKFYFFKYWMFSL